jgi:hypothetical protein
VSRPGIKHLFGQSDDLPFPVVVFASLFRHAASLAALAQDPSLGTTAKIRNFFSAGNAWKSS